MIEHFADYKAQLVRLWRHLDDVAFDQGESQEHGSRPSFRSSFLYNRLK